MRLLPLVVADNSVDSQKDTRAEKVRVVTQFPDVFKAVAGGLAVSEHRAGDVNGIGTAVYRRDADRFIFRRSEELERTHYLREFRAFWASAPNLGSEVALEKYSFAFALFLAC